MLSSDMDISIVIVNWRTRDSLRECLRSVQSQDGVPPIQIIVVDNASEDGSTEMVATEFPQVQLVCNPQNRGFAAACNQGIHLAEGRFILLLNPDTVVPPQTLAKLLAFAETRPDSAVIG